MAGDKKLKQIFVNNCQDGKAEGLSYIKHMCDYANDYCN